MKVFYVYAYVRFVVVYLTVAVVDGGHAHHGDGGGCRRRILRLGDVVIFCVAAQLPVIVFPITSVPVQAKKFYINKFSKFSPQ